MTTYNLRPHPHNLRPYPYPGKYEGGLVIDEYVHMLSLDGGPDEDEGGVADYDAWFGILRGSLYDENSAEGYDLTPDEVEFLQSQAGAIITEYDNGFVCVEYFEDPEELEMTWEEIRIQFGGGEES